MRYQILFVGLIFIIFVLYQSEASNKCFTAKTCLHNAKEICGVDQNQHPRRFFDTCDMKEYNCLRGTNYVKVSRGHCQNLPPIEEKSTKNVLETNEEKSKEVLNLEKSLEVNQEKSNEAQSPEKSLENDEKKEEQGAETYIEKVEEKSIEEQEAEKSLEKNEENSKVEQDAEKSLEKNEENSKVEQDAEPAVDEAEDVAQVKAEDEKKDK